MINSQTSAARSLDILVQQNCWIMMLITGKIAAVMLLGAGEVHRDRCH